MRNKMRSLIALAEEEVLDSHRHQLPSRTRNEGRRPRARSDAPRAQQTRTNHGQVEMTIQEGQRSGTLVAALKKSHSSSASARSSNDFSTTVSAATRSASSAPTARARDTAQALARPTRTNVRHRKARHQFADPRTSINCEPNSMAAKRALPTTRQTVAKRSKTGEARGMLIGYLQDFLFTPNVRETPGQVLSGGERNRLLLAKAVCQAATRSSSTNQRTISMRETLELLEETARCNSKERSSSSATTANF